MEDITPDILEILTERIKESLIPTVELSIKDGKVTIDKKDSGFRVIIHDHDDSDHELDIYQQWEVIKNQGGI